MNMLLALDLAGVEKLLATIPWLKVGIVAGGALLIAIVAVVVRRRRARQAGGAAPALTAGALVRIWERFLAQIPGEFRRYVLHFQGFVVLGEAGSGKSLLIGKCTDWKGQAAQFYPSYTAEPLLQLYLGSRALVQEVPSVVLTDTSSRARTALHRLWKRTARRRPPIVVVAISAATLREASPDALRVQAQTLRGKLNVLARIANAAIETRVVVTHMDQVEGYLAFAEFVEKHEIPHKIELDPLAPGMGLPTCLEPFEEFLPLALTKLPARDYLRTLTFLEKAPATFERLGLLLSTLREDDPRTFEPVVRDLYLSSNAGGGPSSVSNPFETTWQAHGQAIERAVTTRHRLISTGILLAGLAWLGAGFAREHGRLSDARDALQRFQADSAGALERLEADGAGGRTELALQAFDQGASRWEWVLPSYTPGLAGKFRERLSELGREFRERLTSDIREKRLRPIVHELRNSPNAQETSLYLLGLVYADREGQLGRFILDEKADRLGEWSQALKLPRDVIRAYVLASDRPWTGSLSIDALPHQRRVDPVTQPETWHSLLLELQGVLASEAISAERLARFQEMAQQLQAGLITVRRHHTSQDIYARLGDDPQRQRAQFRRYVEDLRLPPWLVDQPQQFDDLLKMIADGRMDVPRLVNQSLDDLVNRLKGITALAAREQKVIQLSLEDKSYSFDEAVWQRVLNNGKAQALVQRFVLDNQASGSAIFFGGAAGSYPSVLMRPPNATEFLFPGNGIVAGEYTKAAYDRQVVPQITNLETNLRTIRLDRETRQELERLVNSAVHQYAAEYERQWRAYYQSWTLSGDSLGTLKLILGQMKLPASRFQDLLRAVVDNTTFAGSSSPYLRTIIDKMSGFAPLADLLKTEGAGSPSKLEDFKGIMARILDDLDAAAPLAAPVPDEAADAADDDFESRLKPLGRLCLDIVRNERDSSQRLVEGWLEKTALVGVWREPFLQPIRIIDALGREDLARAVERSWSERVRAEIVPLLERFPFKAGQPTAATPQELEGVLHPRTGAFWVQFHKFVGPVCVEQVGLANRWRGLKPLETGFAWPADLFPLVDYLAELTATLWDAEGLPRPLSITVRAEPLPRPVPGQQAPILTFIGSGQSTVFGFNQRPTWQTIQVEWFSRVTAQVGLQLGTVGTRERANYSVSVPEQYWALHRLLRERSAEPDGSTFSIATNAPGVPSVLVRFSYKEDPFRLFAVPTFAKEEPHAASTSN